MIKILILVAVAVLTSPSPAPISTERVCNVDRIQINFYHSEHMVPIFEQTIFEDFSRAHNCFIVRTWRLNKFVRDKSDEADKKAWVDKHYKYMKSIDPTTTFENIINVYRGKINPGSIEWPYKNYETNKWEYVFFKDDIKYTVISKYPPIFSYTQYDSEHRNRDIVSENERKPIFGEEEDKNESWYSKEWEKTFMSLMGGNAQ